MSEIDSTDPRLEDSVMPAVGDLYGDARHENDDGTFDEQLRIVYCDDEQVLLRTTKDVNRSIGYAGKHYRLIDRDTFKEQTGAGRLKPIGENDNAPPSPENIDYYIGVVKNLLSKYNQETGNIAKHKSEVLREVITLLEEFEAEEQDWTDVPNIGEKGAESLVEAGIVTDADARAVSEEEIANLDNIGSVGASNVKDHVA